MPNTFI